MSMESKTSGIDQKILAEAAEYYLRLQEDNMSGQELEDWQAWFMQSIEHQLAFRRLETLWGVLGSVSVEHLTETGSANEGQSYSDTASASVIGMVAPQGHQPSRPRFSAVVLGCIAASFFALLIASYLMFSPTGNPVARASVTVYETIAETQQVVRLPDGSILELGPDSKVSVVYSDTQRKLDLEKGQAIFTVAKNPALPFVVKAGNGTVTAIGTVFNVSRGLEKTQVRVMEGTVAVRPQYDGRKANDRVAGAVALVTAGSQTAYDERGRMTPVEKANLSQGLDWRVGVLTMVNRELSDVIHELNRFVENEIAIGDDTVGDFHFTGTVYPDKVDEWLAGLTQGYPLKVVHVGSRTILMLDETAATP